MVWINARISFQRASKGVGFESIRDMVESLPDCLLYSSLYTQEEYLLLLLLTSSLHPSPRSLLPLSSWLRSTDNLCLKDNS